MLYTQNRDEMRRFYCDIWRRHSQGEALDAMQQRICDVMLAHPEYHALLANEESALTQEYTPEAGQTNPFLHMGLHIAILEQLATDRPAGICDLYRRLRLKLGDAHEVEHRIMDCLGAMIWETQRHGTQPDEQQYLECIRSL